MEKKTYFPESELIINEDGSIFHLHVKPEYLAVKGILYYLGCSNVGDPAGQYTERLKMLVEQWRRDF